MTTIDSATAASNCVAGVMAADAMVDLTASRLSVSLSLAKRSVCAGSALCRRTIR